MPSAGSRPREEDDEEKKKKNKALKQVDMAAPPQDGRKQNKNKKSKAREEAEIAASQQEDGKQKKNKRKNAPQHQPLHGAHGEEDGGSRSRKQKPPRDRAAAEADGFQQNRKKDKEKLKRKQLGKHRDLPEEDEEKRKSKKQKLRRQDQPDENKKRNKWEREEGGEGNKKPTGSGGRESLIMDSRFSTAHSDPRFQRLPTRQSKVTIDSRCSRMFSEKGFASSSATVDKRGRPRKEKADNPLLHYYHREEEEDAPAVEKADEEEGDRASALEVEREPSSSEEDSEGYEDDSDVSSSSEEDEDEEDGEMSSSKRSTVQRTRIVDNAPSADMVPLSLPPQLSVTVSSTWGRGTGRRGPTRGITEQRLDLGQRWSVRVVGGYSVGEQGVSFISRMGPVIRKHCKPWQTNFSSLLEETKNAIFRDLEVTFQWDRSPQSDKEMLQHMTAMHKGWRGMLKSRYYKGKIFEDAVASFPAGVDPSDWQILCEKWNTREEQDIAERNRQNRSHQTMTYRRGRKSIYQLKDDFAKTHQREPDRMEIFRMGRCNDLPDGSTQWVDDESKNRYERMTQLTSPDLSVDANATAISGEDAFRAVMVRDRPGRVRCVGRAETLTTWYEGREGSSSSHNTRMWMQDLEQQLEALRAERESDRKHMKTMYEQQLEALRAERESDRKHAETISEQMLQMRSMMQHFAS